MTQNDKRQASKVVLGRQSMRRSMRRSTRVSMHVWRIAAAALLATSSFLSAAHGQIFMSKEQEKQIGAEQHPQILATFGGEFDDPKVSAYVRRIGQDIAANSDDPELGYTVTVLNSPVVNAFALPGGYVYVTRGLMALVNSEAEIAGVIGHEVGHVTARHSAKRYDRAVGTSIFGAILGAVVGSDIVNDLFNIGGAAYLSSFSRDQEFEADLIGVRVLGRTGYDPYAQADVLASMQAQAGLQAKFDGGQYDPNRVDFFSTHPNTGKRVERAIEEAAASGAVVSTAPRRQSAYFSAINGMLYGDDPEQGFVRGRNFSHPQMKFAFTVPEGFIMQNSPDAIVAQHSSGALIQFTGGRSSENDGAMGYLQRFVAGSMEAQVSNVETFDVNGMAAATGVARVSLQSGSRTVRAVAIQYEGPSMFTFIFVPPSRNAGAFADGFQQTALSFRKLSDAEVAALKPLRVKIVTARAGDNVQSLANRLAFDDFQAERFRVINGLDPNEGVQTSAQYKIILQ